MNVEASRSRSLWNVISLVMPFIGFLGGVGAFGIHAEWGQGHPMDHVRTGVRVWFGFAMLGVGAAVFALARAEGWWGITVAALILNLSLLLLTGWASWGQW